VKRLHDVKEALADQIAKELYVATDNLKASSELIDAVEGQY